MVAKYLTPDPFDHESPLTPPTEQTAACRESTDPLHLRISRIEGKWKLSHNHPRQRWERVVDAAFAAT